MLGSFVKEPIVLYRMTEEFKEELGPCQRYFEVTDSRVGIRDRLVFCRYSCLPFYRELFRDLGSQGSDLINLPSAHDYVANFDWYFDLSDLTPRSWFDLSKVPQEGGPFILKGRTNSRKFQWREMMFAKDFQEAVRTHIRLLADPMIEQQGIVIREFVPLRTFGEQLNGLPITNEWRVFCFSSHILAYGYYWSNVDGDYKDLGRESFLSKGLDLVREAASRLSDHVIFFVVDVAEKVDGSWTVIEVNDAQMSGLSLIDPEELYRNLAKYVK